MGNHYWSCYFVSRGATGVFVQLQKLLNNIWGVEDKKSKSDIWEFVKNRLFSFGLIISIAFLLLVFFYCHH
jgi:membrane protein